MECPMRIIAEISVYDLPAHLTEFQVEGFLHHHQLCPLCVLQPFLSKALSKTLQSEFTVLSGVTLISGDCCYFLNKHVATY